MLTIKTTKAGLGATRVNRNIVRINRPARTTRPIVVAGLKEGGDWLASGFMKIFTPPQDGGVNWKATSNGYSVTPSRRRRDTIPYATPSKSDAGSAADALPQDAEKAQQAQNAFSALTEYLAGALQRVMGHNFKGDDTEPDWKPTNTGYTGDIRSRDKDGFHSKKL